MSSENTGSMYNNNSGSAPSRHRPSHDNGLRPSGPSSSRANARANGQSRDHDQRRAQRQTRSQTQGEHPSAGPSSTRCPEQNRRQNRRQNGMDNPPRQGRAGPDGDGNTGTMLETYLNDGQAQYQKFAPDPTASVEKSQRNHIAAMTDILAALELNLPRDQ